MGLELVNKFDHGGLPFRLGILFLRVPMEDLCHRGDLGGREGRHMSTMNEEAQGQVAMSPGQVGEHPFLYLIDCSAGSLTVWGISTNPALRV